MKVNHIESQLKIIGLADSFQYKACKVPEYSKLIKSDQDLLRAANEERKRTTKIFETGSENYDKVKSLEIPFVVVITNIKSQKLLEKFLFIV